MEDTRVEFNHNRRGEIQLFSDNVKVGKMDVAILSTKLVVYHTEVDEGFEGRGFAGLLLERLVNYAKESGLKIVPLCPYVNAQFRRHPEKYAEIWFRE